MSLAVCSTVRFRDEELTLSSYLSARDTLLRPAAIATIVPIEPGGEATTARPPARPADDYRQNLGFSRRPLRENRYLYLLESPVLSPVFPSNRRQLEH